MTLIRNSRIWVIVGADWVPAIVCAVREPGMKARDVMPPGNNGKRHDIAAWVEAVCQHTTEAGAAMLAFPEGDAETGWRSLPFPWHETDPRTWDVWDAANSAETGSKPLRVMGFSEAQKLQVYGKDGGDHPLFLRSGTFCRVVGLPGFSYNLCTVREATP